MAYQFFKSVKQQKVKSAREIKVETVTTLAEKIKKAKTLAFADYRGLTVNQISQLREKVKEAGGELIVTKNSLMFRALTNHQLPVTRDQLTGPTAAVFSYEDELAPIKTIAESSKTTGIPSFKFGFFGRDLLDVRGITSLAAIPSRGELQAKVVGALSSPIYGIVTVLQANVRNLVSVLDQVAKSKA